MADRSSSKQEKPDRPERSRLFWLTVIWVVALLPRLIAVGLTEAPARDGLRYVAAAETFERLPLLEAIGAVDVHPLYPLSLLGVRNLARATFGIEGPYAWLHAGQAWGISCYLAFLSFAFLAGEALWDRRTAGIGCLAVALLPRQVHYSVDLLSDNLHAALWMASLALLARCGGASRLRLLVIAGFLAGAAYWTRLEAVVVPLAFGAAQVVGQCRSAWRLPGKRWLATVGAFCVPCGLVVGGYVALNGGPSAKHSAKAVLGAATVPEPSIDPSQAHSELAGDDLARYHPNIEDLAARNRLDPLVVAAAGGPDVVLGRSRIATAVEASFRLISEVGQETRGWLLALALIALVDPRSRRIRMPAGLYPLLAIAGCAAMLVLLRIKAGYMAGRYLMPVLPFLGMFAVVGADAFWSRFRRMARLPWERAWDDATLRRRRAGFAFAAVGVACMASCVAPWTRPLHRHRHGHLAAARWLAEHSASADLVFDPTCFTAFFADRERWSPYPSPASWPTFRFASIDPSIVHRCDRSTHDAIGWVDRHGRLVAKFPRRPGSDRIGIYLFEIDSTAVAKATASARREWQ